MENLKWDPAESETISLTCTEHQPVRSVERRARRLQGGRMRAARSSDHQDLVTQMKGNPFENVAIAMSVGAKAPTVVGSELHRIDDRHGRTVEERRSDRGVDFDELARLFAAAVVA